MRRSSSSSNIPIQKKDVRNRSKSATRPPSFDKLQGSTFKRSTDSFGLKKSLTGTTPLSTTGYKRSVSQTPITKGYGSQRLGGMVTPSSARSRSKSPNWPGVERSATNPKWVSQQFAKVRLFLESHPNCPDHIPGIIKPPTINTFLFVINLLLKEINPHIEVNNANYKDVVLKTLKMLNYPGNISNSMLKTVNAMHTWPHVITMFSWLIDLITAVRRLEEPVNPELADDIRYKKFECVIDYLAGRYLLYNNGKPESPLDEEFKRDFASLLNINEEEDQQLADEVAILFQRKEAQMKTLTANEIRSDALQKEIDDLQNSIDAFYLNRAERQENIDCETTLLKSRRDKLVAEIQAKTTAIAKLKETIKNQPCTFEEKKKMIKHIEEMKHTIYLKKDKIKAQKVLKGDCEVKLVAAKKKIETEVYRLNTAIMKIVVLEPELKLLHTNETNFLTETFGKKIQTVAENIKQFEDKYMKNLETTQAFLSKIQTDVSLTEEKVEDAKAHKQKLSEQEKLLDSKIEQCLTEIESVSKKRQKEKEEYLKKINELKTAESALLKSKQKYNKTNILKEEEERQLEMKKEQFLDFFYKLHDNTMGNLGDMINIRNSIFETLENCLKQISVVQNNFIEDLTNLEECSDATTK